MKRPKYPHITSEDIDIIGRGFHIEKITDEYNEYFPFSVFDEFLERLFDESVDWSNIDDLGFLSVAFSRVPSITQKEVIKICEFVNNIE